MNITKTSGKFSLYLTHVSHWPVQDVLFTTGFLALSTCWFSCSMMLVTAIKLKPAQHCIQECMNIIASISFESRLLSYLNYTVKCIQAYTNSTDIYVS